MGKKAKGGGGGGYQDPMQPTATNSWWQINDGDTKYTQYLLANSFVWRNDEEKGGWVKHAIAHADGSPSTPVDEDGNIIDPNAPKKKDPEVPVDPSKDVNGKVPDKTTTGQSNKKTVVGLEEIETLLGDVAKGIE